MVFMGFDVMFMGWPQPAFGSTASSRQNMLVLVGCLFPCSWGANKPLLAQFLPCSISVITPGRMDCQQATGGIVWPHQFIRISV
jgi:hypothetical protein